MPSAPRALCPPVPAQVTKHHPAKGAAKTGREQMEIYYPEDNVTEVVDLGKEQWRHITTTVKTSYRGTVIKASSAEGLQVHLDGGTVRIDMSGSNPTSRLPCPSCRPSAHAKGVGKGCCSSLTRRRARCLLCCPVQ